MRVSFRIAIAVLVAVLTASASADFSDWIKETAKRPTTTRRLDPETAAAGLREALEQGTQRAVQALGRENGFWRHPTLRIPVPEKLSGVERGLRRMGQDRIAEDFVRSLNRAAEQATPAAQGIFVKAVREMTIRDAMEIVHGADDAATQYFRRHTETALAAAFRPIVQQATGAVGVTSHYKRLIKRAEPLGLVDTRGLDIDEYIMRKTLDGLFHTIAEEERRIRQDPVARTSELLRRVFGK
jgi:hypothetical protein